MLTISKGTGTIATRTYIGTNSGIVSVQAGSSLRGLVHHDIEHTTRALSIVGSTRVGNDFYILDCRRRHVLEYHTGIRGEHSIGLPIDIYLEVRLTINSNIVLAIDSNHGNLT